ncbi:synaptic vesicle 2-related protein [Trichonephila clavata]|uniref:Synaptic vesicle 2-related protein n=1 Tax=Trichonephila clavata TaxID=2740835 RepID=A0A8X6GPK5_TRICU|nr:synaptic vesicle 2-related protein [Trichonephila clavata]
MFRLSKKNDSENEKDATEISEDKSENETSEEQDSNNAERSETKSNDSAQPASVSSDKEDKNMDRPTEVSYTGDVYEMTDAIDKGGFGWYQILVTFLGGMVWFTAASQIMILTFIGDFLACRWNIYRWQSALLFSVFFFCMSIGSPVFGYLSDNYGRKKSIALYLVIQFSFGAGCAAVNSMLTITLLMAFVGFALGGKGQIITYVCEFYPTKDRGIVGFYTSYYWTTATLFLISVCWGAMNVIDNWRGLLFIAALPALIVLLVINWYPESPWYYQISQQPDKAMERLEVMARMNKVQMPKGRLKPYIKDEDEDRRHFMHFFQPESRSTLLMLYLWFSVSFTYYAYVLITPVVIKYGTIRLSKKMIADSIAKNDTEILMSAFPCKEFTQQNYIDLLWITAAEIPGVCIFSFLVTLVNRNVLLSSACFLSVLTTFLLLVVTKNNIALNVLLFLGRAIICAIYQTLFILTVENFPITLKGFALGANSSFGRLGAAIVPFITQVLMAQNPVSSICIIGIIIFFGGVSAAFLPEKIENKVERKIPSDSQQNVSSHKRDKC